MSSPVTTSPGTLGARSADDVGTSRAAALPNYREQATLGPPALTGMSLALR
jgi:hypothetical protein